MKNLIILSQPRTGSNLLCELFFAYIPFRVLMEFFIHVQNDAEVQPTELLKQHEINALIDYFKLEDRSTLSLRTTLNQNPRSALEALSSIIYQYKVIKVHDFMLDQMDLEFIFDDPETKFIVLERESKIKQYISSINALTLRKWTHVDTSNMKVHVDPADFAKFKEASELWYSNIESKLSSKGYNYLKLTYEQDLENINYDVLLPKINKWLDDNNMKYFNNGYKVRHFTKQNKSNLEDVIENYSEIKELIS